MLNFFRRSRPQTAREARADRLGHKRLSTNQALAAFEALEERRLFSAVDGAYLFYNNSAYDQNDAALTVADHNAIATDKTPIRELETADFSSYSNYYRGLNGLMIDLDGNTPTSLSLDDFTFQQSVGNGWDQQPLDWIDATTPDAFQVFENAGVNGSDRIAFAWDDANAVKNGWLKVTVHDTDATGLSTPDTFYFGSAVAETGDTPGSTRVNMSDYQLARRNLHGLNNPASITDAYDINKDQQVNGSDLLLIRRNFTKIDTSLNLLTAPVNQAQDVSALVVGSDKIAIKWTDASQVENGYRITATDLDGTFTASQSFSRGDGIALFEGLDVAKDYEFNISTLVDGSTASSASINTRSTTSEPEERIVAYKVELSTPLKNGQTNKWHTESVHSDINILLPDVSANEIVVGAASEYHAIQKALQARLLIEHDDGSKKAGAINDTIPESGYDDLAFLFVDDTTAFEETYTEYAGPSSSAEDGEWLVLAEGKYEAGADNTGYDWDDWYAKIEVTPLTLDSTIWDAGLKEEKQINSSDTHNSMVIYFDQNEETELPIELMLETSGSEDLVSDLKWAVSGPENEQEVWGIAGSDDPAKINIPIPDESDIEFVYVGIDTDVDGKLEGSEILDVFVISLVETNYTYPNSKALSAKSPGPGVSAKQYAQSEVNRYKNEYSHYGWYNNMGISNAISELETVFSNNNIDWEFIQPGEGDDAYYSGLGVGGTIYLPKTSPVRPSTILHEMWHAYRDINGNWSARNDEGAAYVLGGFSKGVFAEFSADMSNFEQAVIDMVQGNQDISYKRVVFHRIALEWDSLWKSANTSSVIGIDGIYSTRNMLGQVVDHDFSTTNNDLKNVESALGFNVSAKNYAQHINGYLDSSDIEEKGIRVKFFSDDSDPARSAEYIYEDSSVAQEGTTWLNAFVSEELSYDLEN